MPKYRLIANKCNDMLTLDHCVSDVRLSGAVVDSYQMVVEDIDGALKFMGCGEIIAEIDNTQQFIAKIAQTPSIGLVFIERQIGDPFAVKATTFTEWKSQYKDEQAHADPINTETYKAADNKAKATIKKGLADPKQPSGPPSGPKTMSEQIRELARTGMRVGPISKQLNISYQQAFQVVTKAGLKN